MLSNYFWIAVIIILATTFGAIFLATTVNEIIQVNNSTQFENCKVYTIDDRRAILNCTDAKLLCEVTD
jgi:hypothetical protein